MFGFVSKNLILLIHNRNHNVYGIQQSIYNSLRLLQTLALDSPNANTCDNPIIQDNPTVSYLNRKCGLPLDSAITASKEVAITNTQRADSVLQLFKSYNFTPPQITHAITKCPNVLVVNADTNLKPKLDYFMSLGLSKPDFLAMFTNKAFLTYSLANSVANVEFLKSILHTNENVIRTLRHWSYMAFRNFRLQVKPNILILRDRGVPEPNIVKLLMSQPRTFLIDKDVFRESVRRAEELGFRSNSLAYVRAVQVMATTRRPLWEKKVDVFKSYGWSDNDIMVAFKKQVLFMTCSEKKIRILMDFYLNMLCLKVSDVVNFPNLLSLSLEKRILPRCSVLHVLLSKGLIINVNIVAALIRTKGAFDKAYVTKYRETVPEIVSGYQGEKGFSEFEVIQLADMIHASNKSISLRITEKTISESNAGISFQKC